MSVYEFHNFVSNIYNSPEFERLNGYTTVLMCNHYNTNDIMNYRKQWFVNNFTNFNNIDKQQYYDYYDKYITDSFSGNFAPPPCFLNTHDRFIREEQAKNEKEIEENQNDDVYLHYVDISNKYRTIVQFQQYNKYNNEENSENEDSFYESEYQSSENISIYSDIDEYNYDDDYDVYEEESQYEDDYDY